MYKSKVQELCQKRLWSLPEYQTSREGLDHNPRFNSTVTVNGLHFQCPAPCRSAKEAQNNAAMLAFDHFTQASTANNNPSPPPQPKLLLRPKPVPGGGGPPSPPPPPRSLLKDPNLPGLDSFPQPIVPRLSSFSQPSSLFAASATSSSSSYVSSGPSTNPDDILPTSRALQQKLEEACQAYPISRPIAAVSDIEKAEDQKSMAHLYKNQLQSYVQKRNLKLPAYSSEWEGPPHALRFKCKVTVDGQTFESPKFFSAMKDAEHAAAEVALMSLSSGGFHKDCSMLYKNLLQELVQKEGFSLPVYTTNKSGEPHLPIFVSQVEVEGEVFTGQEAKIKKQAEMSAAKVAYTALKERQGKSEQMSANPRPPGSPVVVVSRNQPDKNKGKPEQRSLFPLSDHQGKAPETNVITGLQHHANPKSPVSPVVVSRNQPDKTKEPVVTMKKGPVSTGNTNGGTEDSSLSSGQPALPIMNNTKVASNTNNMSSTAVPATARRRVAVYARGTNVPIDEGGTLLPISDDKCAAYSYSN